MAIYHVRIEKGGGYSIQAEMGNGRSKSLSGKWLAKDKAALRVQAQNLALLVKDVRAGRQQLRGAQVYLGEEKI